MQRKVTFTPGTELAVRNVALASMGKANGVRPSAAYGETPSVFNQQEFPPTPDDQLLTAFVVNTVESHAGFRTSVQVPNQIVSWVMELPTDGPWVSGKLSADFVAAQIGQDMDVPAQHAINKIDGQVTVIAEGDPNDSTLVSQIRKHEHKHAKNTADVVGEIVQPWDDNLEAYAQEIAGKSSPDPLSMALDLKAQVPTATAAVSKQMAREIKRRDLAYHASPDGRDPKIVAFRVEGKKGEEVVHVQLRLDKV
ncbi:MAG TPA: hypothetical protein VIH93_16405 [Thermoanaerobaculia bacterium]